MATSAPASIVWRRFLRQRLAVASAIVLTVLFALCLCAPLLAAWRNIDPTEADLLARLEPSSMRHWLGTDDLGRDLLQRLLDGGRISLLVAASAALIAAMIGAPLGAIAGYAGGPTDSLLMRLTDFVIALPLLPLLIVLAAVDLGKLGLPEEVVHSDIVSIYRIVGIVALTGWTTVARLVRAETLSLRSRDFVRAAIGLGASPARVILRHILPNTATSIVVATTLSIGSIVLLESILSFLGLGIQPPNASWGNMLTNAQDLIQSAPLLMVWPGLLIFVTVIAFNFVGDGLQAAFDPRDTGG